MRAIGVNTWVWTSPLTDESITQLAAKVAGWGFDVLELPVENLGDWSPAHAAKVLGEHGLGASVCLVMPPGRELVSADAATVASTQDYLRSVVDIAAEVGSPVIAGPAYTSVGRTWRLSPAERAIAYAELRDHLAPVVEHARSAAVRVAVEPLNRYETSLLNTVGQTLEALDGLPVDGCGVALDIYHQNIEEQDIAAAVRAARGRIAHVQVCANDRGAPGADHLDWPGFLAALAEADYSGPLCVESFTAENASIATAASIWRPLAASQDALAVDGLRFLREVVGKSA
ncbi:D-psicose/D-tagatose/L-ribulose 3-epimerase [Actinokineospora alba]|uniref:D-psicose/D-tagatose/L-ribulose 3-epimerase n=1 Tax=Actinokineospora alba TaxID=504798 RepID=A0A1H0NNL2_9PSEU|nr:sugar phosphate isomerase/epimerase family protein [Actinokineospora alba]TDP68781.1 D-psicose/D-tagatose/L-ribulose 3-epimerase [Actinokineospora alba]SDH86547.1 D-psicose/D-tagatose/L-ribulose 3-epimerase [Actinokineospora alba]SDO94148.1 D-psicose/D-tagatose/L-ribulose 3-epimerase [Actinokineospora alba]